MITTTPVATATAKATPALVTKAPTGKPTSSLPAGALTARQAANHIGENKTVCGKAVSATFASSSGGRPTFLNLDQPYPQQVFTIVIWGDYRNQYRSAPEKMFNGKTVCVKGRIGSYRGIPQMEARSNRVWVP